MIRKYRAWHIEQKRMFKVYSINFEYQKVEDPEMRVYSFNEVVLLESTGLKDKHEREIFEGDMIDFFAWDKPREVVFKDGYFSAQNKNIPLLCEVIGNIYQNGNSN